MKSQSEDRVSERQREIESDDECFELFEKHLIPNDAFYRFVILLNLLKLLKC